jgi:hypothetical protein
MYRTGFIGASTQEATQWVAQSVGDARTICVPFAGSGRDIFSMAGPDRLIESWDTQFYSRAVVEGVFAAKEMKTNVDAIRYRKGYMFETRSLKNIDERSAGFIDWVADEGTMFDKAAMSSAIVRCTLMGRMTQWYANVEQLYARFLRARENNLPFLNAPGEFIHHEGSVLDYKFEDIEPFDLMQVDPPKVVVGGDVYSSNFDVLNKAMHGAVETLPKWTSKVSLANFRQLMNIPTKRILFMYVSGVKPTYEEVRRMLLEYGEPIEEKSFTHRGRTDYGIILDRRNHSLHQSEE